MDANRYSKRKRERKKEGKRKREGGKGRETIRTNMKLQTVLRQYGERCPSSVLQCAVL